jgi:chromosome segregation protein
VDVSITTDIAGIPGIELLRSHVRSQEGKDGYVERLLDILLEGVWVVHGGREEAAEVSMSYPRAVVVTRDGDRFSRDGWHIRSSQGVHTYVGRVSVADIEIERRRREAAAERLRSAAVRLDSARAQATESSRSVEELTAEVSNLDRQAVARDADIKQLRYEISSESDQVARIRKDREARTAEIASKASELEELRPKLERIDGDGVNLADHAERAASAYSDLELKRQSVESLRRRLEIEAAGISERRVMLQDRLAGIAVKRESYLKQEQEAREKIVYLESCIAGIEGLERMANSCMTRLEELSGMLRSREEGLSKEFQGDADRLDILIQDRARDEASLNALRDRNSELMAALSQDDARSGTLEGVLREELGRSLGDVADMDIPELEDGTAPEMRIAELEKQITALGPINALALDELVVLEERYAELKTQVEDVQHARNEVLRSVNELDAEITRMFTETFEEVNSNFQQIIGTLMPGGTGRLELTNTDNLLECGLEIEARPAGKGVRRLSLLSGGERSLVTLAFLFAIFRSRTSPFYVMDEVEAALDDINLHNFLELARQFRDAAQLIIVTHQKRTMEMADVLYGVSMSRDGTSKVVSKKLDEEV